METLLQETDLTLAKTISKCQAQEATKKQRASLASPQPEIIGALPKLREKRTMAPPTTLCPGCGAATHQAGRTQCHAYNQACFCCQKVSHFAKVCRSKGTRRSPHTMATQTLASTPTVKLLTTSNIQKASTDETAPLLKVHVTSINGSREMEVLQTQALISPLLDYNT